MAPLFAARMTDFRRHAVTSGPKHLNSVQPCCPLRPASLWVPAGRPVSAKFSKPRSGTLSVPAQEEEWSRGCRRAHKSFWLWLWPPSWQLAHRKRRSLHRNSPSSRRKPASTSNTAARAWRFSPAGPAAFFILPPSGPRLSFPLSPAGSRPLRGALSARLACGLARSQAKC
jgi:hypothetical protein